METKLYCVGMRVEQFVDEGPGSDSYDMLPISNKRYMLYCVAITTFENGYKDTRKIIITLKTSYGWCGSGYCTASFGSFNYKQVDNFGPMTHKPKTPNIEITGLEYDYKEDKFLLDYDACETNLFYMSATGDDDYYPMGRTEVNLDLFEEIPRAIKERPVWIFYGDSRLGKSTLGYYLKENYTIYETDSNEALPEEIWADIIVIGNKWHHTLEAVTARIAEKDSCKIIPVKFGV